MVHSSDSQQLLSSPGGEEQAAPLIPHRLQYDLTRHSRNMNQVRRQKAQVTEELEGVQLPCELSQNEQKVVKRELTKKH